MVKVDNEELTKFFLKESEADKSVNFGGKENSHPLLPIEPEGYQHKTNKGYSNPFEHLRSCIGETLAHIYFELKNAGGIIERYFYSSDVNCHIYRLMQWVILGNPPLFELAGFQTRSLLNFKPPSSKSMRK